MRKHGLTLILALSLSTTYGQVKQSSFLLGFDAGYSKTSQDYYSGTTRIPGTVSNSLLTFQPAVGFFISDRWVAGAQVSWLLQKNSDSVHGYPGTPEVRSLNYGVFTRRYFPIAEKAWIFFQGDISTGQSKIETEEFNPVTATTESTTNTTHTFNVAIRPGIVYFVTPRLGLEAMIGSAGYSHVWGGQDSFNTGNTYKADGFTISFASSSLNLGFRYYLAKKASAAEALR